MSLINQKRDLDHTAVWQPPGRFSKVKCKVCNHSIHLAYPSPKVSKWMHGSTAACLPFHVDEQAPLKRLKTIYGPEGLEAILELRDQCLRNNPKMPEEKALRWSENTFNQENQGRDRINCV